jgi:predicted nucleic acid-binding protein
MTDKPKHYLDSGVFSGFLNREAEPDNFLECKTLIQAAEQEEIEAYTSAFSMGEVVYIKTPPGMEPLLEEIQEKIISDIFLSPWLRLVSFEREMAEINRYLMRQYGGSKKDLRPYDSVHLATAIRMKVDFFNTIDDELIKRLPPKICCPPRYTKLMIIQRPLVDKFQMPLIL